VLILAGVRPLCYKGGSLWQKKGVPCRLMG
jgi:hypothetical protein